MAAPPACAGAFALAILLGCNHAGRGQRTAAPSTPTSPAPGETSVDPALQPLVNAAIDDLAKRLNVDALRLP
jgi:hypothetical protein